MATEDPATRPSKRHSRDARHYPSPSPSSPASPPLPSTSQFGGTSSTLTNLKTAPLPSIAATLEIPPYNPHKRRQAPPEVSNALAKGLPAHAAPRPATTTVVPIPTSYPLTPDSSHNGGTRQNQQRASHTVSGLGNNGAGQVYQPQHLQSANGKRPVYFGNYLLLQTLGEGEFGKVKLGVHSERWGEEVAIKLIKRGSVQDSTTRMAKVSREIEVLRVVKHPYIVRLYDVIETEKYIGIVLEYASGGELFDHILAHRYLKERDACKLFAQLISGVSYLHAKKIVHRDLKLENLLLDRNRNIIITDFGFANRFGDRSDDLMATSCGSPCYAAPELVVQDGKYVGTAVDVWSCGVILYAMLAGYLPFDDDPANPDGDNINLLYKYIINTPLSFPEWIGPEPRDLLLRMLIPDPVRRAGLEEVGAHRWLSRYAHLLSLSVQDQEEAAHQQEMHKREALNRQRVQMEQKSTANAPPLARSQSTAIPVTSTRYQPPDPLVENASRMIPPSDRRAHAQSAIITPLTPPSESDPFSHAPTVSLEAPPMAPSASAPSHAAATEAELEAEAAAARRRKAQNHRYTVQLEYTSPTVNVGPETRSKSAKRRAPPTPESELAAFLPPPEEASEATPMEIDYSEPRPPTELPPLIEIPSPQASRSPPKSPPLPIQTRTETKTAELETPITPIVLTTSPIPKVMTPPVTPEKNSEVPFPPSPEVNQTTPRAARTSVTSRGSSGTAEAETSQSSPKDRTRPPSSASTRANRHRKGLSSDRFFLSRLLGTNNSSSSLEKAERSSGTLPTAPATTSLAYSPGGRPRTASATRAPNDPLATPTGNNEALDEMANSRKGARRKALSLVVEPFSASKSSPLKNSTRKSTQDPTVTSFDSAGHPRTRSTAIVTSPTSPDLTPRRPTTANQAVRRPTTAEPPNNARSINRPAALPSLPSATFDSNWNLAASMPQPGKAKRVMDWFRWRSLPRENTVADLQPPSIRTDFDRPVPSPPSSASTVMPNGTTSKAPTVVVTNPTADDQYDSGPSSRSASGAQSDLSEMTAATTVTTGSSLVHSSPKTGSTVAPPAVKVSAPEAFNDAKLRFHQGAVDQEAITSRPPPAVVIDIRKALLEMGLDVREEAGPFRLKCVRRSQKKVAATMGIPVTVLQSSTGATAPRSSLMAASTFGPASSERLAATGNLSTSPSSTFRAFFSRRGSSTSVSQTSSIGHGTALSPIGMPSPSLTISSMNFDSPQIDGLASPLSRTTSNFGTLTHVPYYGEDDSGAEIRFSVEISRMKNLSGLYSVDIRRLKGDLWAYRGIYKNFLERLDLQ